jgi:Uri superfamily endonuclease
VTDAARPTGTYTLLLGLDRPTRLTVGTLGERSFGAGAYAYTGSAFGPGGLGRVERHRCVAAGGLETRHWHVDHLLGEARLRAAYTAPGAAIECEVARSLPGERVAGFGASDCGCDAHLAFTAADTPLRAALERWYPTVRWLE